MPRFVVAFRTEEFDQQAKKPPGRIADSSSQKVKERMRKYPGSRWTVRHYDVKPNVENICQMVANILARDKEGEPKIPPTDEYDLRVNDQGQCRKV